MCQCNCSRQATRYEFNHGVVNNLDSNALGDTWAQISADGWELFSVQVVELDAPEGKSYFWYARRPVN